MKIYQVKKASWSYDYTGHYCFDGYESVGNPFKNRDDALMSIPYEEKISSGLYPKYIIEEIEVQE